MNNLKNLLIFISKEIITQKARPLWAFLSVMLVGIPLILLITSGSTYTAAIVVGILTLMFATILSISIYFSNRNDISFYEIADVPHNSYKSLKTELTWTIYDPKGTRAELHRKKTLLLFKETPFIKEYHWGKGSLEKGLHLRDIRINGKHTVAELTKEGSRDVAVIALDKIYKKNDKVDLEMTRTIHKGFTFTKEWVEILITIETDFAILKVNLPEDRSFSYAYGIHRQGDYSREVQIGVDGLNYSPDKLQLIWEIPNPIYHSYYTIMWEW